MKSDKKRNLKQFFKIYFFKYSFLISAAMPHGSLAASVSCNCADNDADNQTVQNDSIKINSFTKKSSRIPFDNLRIGNWTGNNLPFYMAEKEISRFKISELPQKANDFVPHGQIAIMDSTTAVNGKRALAVCHADDGSIFMGATDYKAADKITNQESHRYLLGDVFVQNSVAYHEINHSAHFKYLGIDAKYNTPVNAAKYKNMTENLAHISNYLSTAYQYELLKQQGITEVQIKGNNYPLEYILNTYPGLREIYDRYGFDLKNKKVLSAYVDAGIVYKNTAKSDYEQQCYSSFLRARAYSATEKTFATRYNEAKSEDADFEKISRLMVKKVYIGNNTCVNLSHFYQRVNDMSTQDVFALVEKISKGKDHVVASENLVAIGNYLDSIGIQDADKDKYITQNFFLIADKKKNADQGLKNLMIQSQTAYSQKTMADILYGDGTHEIVYSEKENKNNVSDELAMYSYSLIHK